MNICKLLYFLKEVHTELMDKHFHDLDIILKDNIGDFNDFLLACRGARIRLKQLVGKKFSALKDELNTIRDPNSIYTIE